VITESIGTVERFLMNPSFDPTELPSRLREAASNARAPLLTAGLAYRTVHAGLMVLEIVAEEVAVSVQHGAGLDPGMAVQFDDANRVVFFFVEALDRERRYRRSTRTLRALGSRISDWHINEEVHRRLSQTEFRRTRRWLTPSGW